MPIRTLFFFVGFLLLAGCSKSSDALPALHPVKGKITKNNKAVGKGYVRFTPEQNENFTIQGEVSDNGEFELESVKDGKKHKGAPVGSYTVFYSPGEGADQLQLTPIETTKRFAVEAHANELTIELIEK